MWDLSFSQQWRWRLKFSAIWRCVVGCIIPNVSKDCGASVFTVMKWEKSAWCLRHTNRPNDKKMCALDRRTIEWGTRRMIPRTKLCQWRVPLSQMSWWWFKSSGILHHRNRQNSQKRVTCLLLLEPEDTGIIVFQNIGKYIYQSIWHKISEDATLETYLCFPLAQLERCDS
jgi:hypothetical protein